MRLAFSTIKTSDLESSLRFYKEIIGLTEMRRINPQPGVHCVFLKDENNSVLELVGYDNAIVGSKEHKGSVSIGFSVEDMDKTIAMLKDNGIEIVSGPIETPGGVRLLFIEDPNGVEVEFVEGFN